MMGIVSIQRLGNFMGYSLNQSSMIVSGESYVNMGLIHHIFSTVNLNCYATGFTLGLWGIFYYKEIAGAFHIIGFLASVCIVFVGILLLGREHMT